MENDILQGKLEQLLNQQVLQIKEDNNKIYIDLKIGQLIYNKEDFYNTMKKKFFNS